MSSPETAMSSSAFRKNIWIINEYAGSPELGMEFRHYYLAKELVKRGYHVLIISATHSHQFIKTFPAKKWFNFHILNHVEYLRIKVLRYRNSQSLLRVVKWFWFTFSLFFLPVKKLARPDFIILSPMQTLPIFPAFFWAKKFRAKLVFEVKDIWPLSITELGNYSPQNPFIRLLKFSERWALKKSDAIVSVLENYGEYLKEQGFDRTFTYIPNGIDLEEMQQQDPLAPEIVNRIPTNKFIVGYTGSIGVADALEYLIDSAFLLKDHTEIFFVIAGKGENKERLIEKVKAQGLNNIMFLPPVPKKQIQALLKKFDVCVVSYLPKKLYSYGSSPNKVFDYMYASRPIISGIQTPNNIIEKAGCGECISEVTVESYVRVILKLYEFPKEQRHQLGAKGHEFVINNHAHQVLAERYDELLRSL